MEALDPRADVALSWSSIPTTRLLEELSRRNNAAAGSERPACGSGKRGSYDTGLHVFALFLILIVSTLACGFPLVSNRVSKGSKRQRAIIFICQHFGTGVLMATAFVHLLPTAFTSLTDPCLPYFFNQGYRPLAGLVAMVAALVVVALESYLTTRGASHSHSHHVWDDSEDSDGEEGADHTRGHIDDRDSPPRRGRGHRPADVQLEDLEATEGLVVGASPLPGGTPTLPPSKPLSFRNPGEASGDEDDDDDDDLELSFEELRPAGDVGASSQPRLEQRHRAALIPKTERNELPPLPQVHIPNAEEQRRMLLQCVLLEAGILFHSVFIGMALSVATGPTFVVFLVAIAFHQSFEGLALGTRIAAIHFPKSSPRPWLMVLAFGATTPIGQAIGLFIHRFYDPMSQTGLLMVGFMNAISSGLLLFAGLVQLLAEDFLSEKSYKVLHGRKRVNAYLSVVGGAALMSAVGAFA